jgi:hypothetical protein
MAPLRTGQADGWVEEGLDMVFVEEEEEDVGSG